MDDRRERLRAFGWFFALIGTALAAISARAISDPQSPIGWDRWTQDPWSMGLILGGATVSVGLLILFAKSKVSPPVERRTTQVLCAGVAGIVGFLLFAPFGVTAVCADGPSRGGCKNQDWSTVTGFTFSGDPNPALAIAVGTVVAVGTWLLVGGMRERSH